MMSWERYQREIEKANDEYCIDHRIEHGEIRDKEDFECEDCKGADECKFNPLR